MAEIQVDVTLPSATSVDVTSPTQALAANVIIPGPQGPRGAPTTINGLSNENIYLSGTDGIKIFNIGVNTIFISGSGNYFLSSINDLNTNLNSTGLNLENKISSLSGTVTGKYVTKSNGQFSDRPTVNGTGILLSGEAAGLPTTILYTTGNQIKSGRLIIGNNAEGILDPGSPYTLSLQSNNNNTWLEILNYSGAGQGVFFGINGNDLEQYNYQAGDILFFTSENPSDGILRLIIKNDGKVGIGTNSPSEKLEVIGNIKGNNIYGNNLVYNTGPQTISGVKSFDVAPTLNGNPFITGMDLSSYLTSSNASTTYATISNLALTGSTLETQINNLGDTYATDSELSTVQTNLNNKITSLSGDAVLLKGNQIIQGQKTFTGSSVLIEKELYVYGSGYFPSGIKIGTDSIIIDGNKVLVNNDPVVVSATLTQTGNAIYNSIGTLSGNSVLSYGEQTIGGIKIFSGNNVALNIASGASLTVSGNPVLTGVDLSSYATNINLALTGSTLQTQINNLDNTYATDIALASTGSTLVQSINNLNTTLINDYYPKSNPSGFITGVDLSSYLTSSNASITYATISNLALTGSNLQTQINNLGTTYATNTNLALTGSTLNTRIDNLGTTYATNTNLALTGSTLNTKIDSLSGSAVLLYGDQNINGNKTFRNNVYINNLYVTGAETILNTINNNISSPYLLLNLTGGLTDGGIFFVTGSGLTGINDTGVIFGFDNITKTWHFGQGTRLTDISTLDEVMGYHDLTGYSGYANQTFSTITNLANTGSNLQGQINNLGNTYATVTNLASTGSTLDSKINSLSGVSVLTFGNQLINGTKTFNSGVVINVQPTGTNPALYITGTWNDANIPYSGLVIDITDTNSKVSNTVGDTSYLLELKKNGSSQIALTHKTNYSTSLPSIHNTSNNLNIGRTNTSLYFGATQGGNAHATLTNNGFTVRNSSTIGWSVASAGSDVGSQDLILAKDLSGILAQRNGTNPQQFRVYNSTGTNSGEFGLFGWQNNQLFIGAQNTSSGISREVLLTGNRIISTVPLIISGADLSGINTNGTQGFRLTSRSLGLLGDSLQTVLTNEGYGGITLLGTDNNTVLRIQRGDNSSAVLNNNTSLGWYKPSPSNVGEIPDVRLWRDGSGILALRTDNISRGSAYYITPSGMQFRVYNITGTNTGEFALFGWQNNNLIIGSQATNSGILRNITITGSGIINLNPLTSSNYLRFNTNQNNAGYHEIGYSFHTANSNSQPVKIVAQATQANGRGYLEFWIQSTGGDGDSATAADKVLTLDGNSVTAWKALGNGSLTIDGSSSTNKRLELATDLPSQAASTLLLKAGNANYINRAGGELIISAGKNAGNGTTEKTIGDFGGAISFRVSTNTGAAGDTNTLVDRARLNYNGLGLNTLNPQALLDISGLMIASGAQFRSNVDIYNSTNPQSLRIFNSTGTNSGEFGLFGWQNNNLIVGPQQTTSGFLRDLILTGNNININASGVLNIFDNTNISGNVIISGNLNVNTRPTVNGTGVLLSGEAASLPNTIVYTTGNQTISGNLNVSGTGSFNGLNLENINNLLLSGMTINITGNSIVNVFNPIRISGNQVLTGVTQDSRAVLTSTNQAINGIKTFNTELRSNSLFGRDSSTSPLVISGSSFPSYLAQDIKIFPGLENRNVDISNIRLNNNIYQSYAIPTGKSSIDNNFIALRGGPNYLINFPTNNTGLLEISIPPSSFNSSYPKNIREIPAATSGLIVNLKNIGQGKFTISGLGVVLRNDPDGEPFTYVSIPINNDLLYDLYPGENVTLMCTGNDLGSTFAPRRFISLDSSNNYKISGNPVLTGVDLSSYATNTDLASTGSKLQTNINNLSGYINSSNSNIVFTTGNQNISDIKTFLNNQTFSGNIGVSGTGIFNAVDLDSIDNLYLSGIDISITGSTINVFSNILISGNPVLTGVNLSSYATTTNLTSTGSALDNKINSLSGASVLTFGNQTIAGNKTFSQTGEFQAVKINKNRFLSYDYETGNFNITDYITIVNCTLTGSGDFVTGTLPGGNISGFNHIIKNINACPVVITGSTNYTIDNTFNLYIYSGESVELLGVTATNLTGWYTMNTNLGVV